VCVSLDYNFYHIKKKKKKPSTKRATKLRFYHCHRRHIILGWVRASEKHGWATGSPKCFTLPFTNSKDSVCGLCICFTTIWLFDCLPFYKAMKKYATGPMDVLGSKLREDFVVGTKAPFVSAENVFRKTFSAFAGVCCNGKQKSNGKSLFLTVKWQRKKRKTVYGKYFRKPFSKTKTRELDHYTYASLLSLSSLCTFSLSALCSLHFLTVTSHPEPPPCLQLIVEFSLSARFLSLPTRAQPAEPTEPPPCLQPVPSQPSHPIAPITVAPSHSKGPSSPPCTEPLPR
jgi:hypothetical protein